MWCPQWTPCTALSAGVFSPALTPCLGLLSTSDGTLGITTSGLAWPLQGGKGEMKLIP